MSMEKHGELDIKYENGLMIIKADGFNNGIVTPQQFKLPLKIAARAKTDREIAIKYAKGAIYVNNEYTPNALSIWDIIGDEWTVHQKCGELPVDEFVDIEWIFSKDVMAFKVNDEIRHISDDYKYIKLFKENLDFSLSSPVTIEADCGATVTVESLRVTEL